jgi:uncharacterized protein Yka (UPF0111/DUF47 family)
MKFISRLMPQEKRFYAFFNDHVDLIKQGGVAVVQLLASHSDSIERTKQIERIQDLEHRADRITHDCVALISRLDDILDLIQDTAESFALYDIQKLTPEAQRLAECLKQCCDKLQVAVGLLSDLDRAPEILTICQQIDSLESDADRIMRAAISSLFRDEPDTRQVIKLKAVYELLEAATDKCQDVANVIESLVLENS